MPYTMNTDGLEDVSRMLASLGEKAESVAAQGLYDGAGEMADALQKSVDGIKTEPFRYTVFGQRSPSPEEKAVLGGAIGIARFSKNGSEVDTSVGFRNAGYAEIGGKLKPVPMIANAINSGTSFMQKQPFFRKGVSAGSKRAEEAIRSTIEEKIGEMTKEK